MSTHPIPYPPNPTPIKSHELCRDKVCVVCLRKADRVVSPSQITEIQASTKLFKSIHPSDERVPKGICNSCSIEVNKIIKGKTGITLKIPNEGFCYSKEVHILPNTRGNSGDDVCSCLICKIGRSKLFDIHPFYGVSFKNLSKKGVGRTPTLEKKEEFEYNKKLDLKTNLMIMKEKDPKLAGQFACEVIKSLPASSDGHTKYLPQMHGGRPKPITEGKHVQLEKTVVSHDKLADHTWKWSMRKTRDLAKFLNSLPNVMVQANFQQDLVARDRELSEFYEGEWVDFVNSDIKKRQKIIKDQPLVYAKNAEELIFHFCGKKGIVAQEIIVQVFFDGGKSRLILSAVIVSNDWEEADTSKGRHLAGVNHAVILGASPKCDENHNNFRIFLQKTQIHRLKKFFSLDDKAKAFILGHVGSSATFPSFYDLTPKQDFKRLEQTGETRTVASVAQSFMRFRDDGAKREDSRLYDSIALEPQVFGSLEEHVECQDPVSHHVVPSVLHYMLNNVNMNYNVMNSRFPEEVARWVKVSTAKESGDPKLRFKGPDCIKLLKNLNVFEDRYGNPTNIEMVPYINCLKSFDKVRETCFVKKILDDDEIEQCHKVMEKFRRDCLVVIEDFDVPAINSMYACVVHVMKWIDHFKVGLGFVIEQTGESLHEDLDIFFKNKAMISNTKNPNYLISLLKNVVAISSEKCRRQPV